MHDLTQESGRYEPLEHIHHDAQSATVNRIHNNQSCRKQTVLYQICSTHLTNAKREEFFMFTMLCLLPRQIDKDHDELDKK